MSVLSFNSRDLMYALNTQDVCVISDPQSLLCDLEVFVIHRQSSITKPHPEGVLVFALILKGIQLGCFLSWSVLKQTDNFGQIYLV